MRMTITSLQNERIADLLALSRKRYRDETGLFVVEGPHLVGEAVAAGLCRTVFATVDPGYSEVDTVLVTDQVMSRIAATFTPQGIVAVVERPDRKSVGTRVLLLDRIQDPGNVGTLLRSALAFGFHDVVADGCADFYNQKTLRATQGAVFRLNLLETSLPSFLKEHPEFSVYGTDPRGDRLLESFVPDEGPIALLLGNEGAGVRPELLSATKGNIRIETVAVESLNVAVAGSIAMHRLRAD
jgi:TrmH family RNA methyltransferase